MCTYQDNRLLCGLGWSETVYLFILDMVSLCRSGWQWAQISAYICLSNAGIKDGYHNAWLQFFSYIVQAGLNPWFSSLSTGIMGMGHNAKLWLTQIISEAFTMANKMIQDLFQTSYSLPASLLLATWPLLPFCKFWDASPSRHLLVHNCFPNLLCLAFLIFFSCTTGTVNSFWLTSLFLYHLLVCVYLSSLFHLIMSSRGMDCVLLISVFPGVVPDYILCTQ